MIITHKEILRKIDSEEYEKVIRHTLQKAVSSGVHSASALLIEYAQYFVEMLIPSPFVVSKEDRLELKLQLYKAMANEVESRWLRRKIAERA